jgi:hypothetical protein
MSRDEIIRMMGWSPYFDRNDTDWRNQVDDLLARIEKVAQSAAAAEREACAKVAEQTPTTLLPSGSFFSERVAAAIRARGQE